MGNGERDNALREGRVFLTGKEFLDSPEEEVDYTAKLKETFGPKICTCSIHNCRGCECWDALTAGVEKEAKDTEGAESFYFFETLLDEAHPMSKLFYDKLLKAALLHSKKQRDYGKDSDPFANVRASEEWGVPGWVGAMIRATDKVRRLQTHATRGSLINESVEDSLLDLAVYALIALVLYEQDLATHGESVKDLFDVAAEEGLL